MNRQGKWNCEETKKIKNEALEAQYERTTNFKYKYEALDKW